MFEEFELAPDAQQWIHLVWFAPLVIGLYAWGISARAKKLGIFGYDPARSVDWLRSLGKLRLRRAFLFAAALICLTAAAVQPRTNPAKRRFKTAARDIVVLLDVSRSMLAADLQPNRLERAKLELERLSEHLEGDRIGLVVFAGDAVIKCPLTSNYSYFKRMLKTVDPRSASQGGTKIGDAVRKALTDLLGIRSRTGETEEPGVKPGETILAEERKGERENFADLLLITDGEDMDSYPVHAARAAAEANVGIYAVGLGSKQGAPIPIKVVGDRVEYLRSSDGEVVHTKLDSKTLYEMVNVAPRGHYLPVGTYNFDLVDFFEQTLAQEEGRDIYDEQVFWTEIFQPFLLAGLVLYLIHILLPERPKSGQLAGVETSP
jgi:Ca-activated chloride channel family protein